MTASYEDPPVFPHTRALASIFCS